MRSYLLFAYFLCIFYEFWLNHDRWILSNRFINWIFVTVCFETQLCTFKKNSHNVILISVEKALMLWKYIVSSTEIKMVIRLFRIQKFLWKKSATKKFCSKFGNQDSSFTREYLKFVIEFYIRILPMPLSARNILIWQF